MAGSAAMNSLVPMTGSTSSGDTDTETERASQPAAAYATRGAPRRRVAGRVRGRGQRVPDHGGTGSTGVPMDRSTAPSGCGRGLLA